MEVWWYAALGAAFAGYFVFAGLDYGVGLLLWPTGRADEERRGALNSLGPLFLGNEVWIVAAVGLLIGAFPLLEIELFHAYRSLVLTLLLALVAVAAAVQLRSRPHSASARATLDLVVAAASAVLAFGWGALLGGLLGGGLHPYSLLTGVAFTALIALHGIAFLAWRRPSEAVGVRAAALALPVAGVAVVAIVAALLTVPATVPKPGLGLGLAAALLVAVAAAAAARWAGRPRLALAATALAVALPVFVVGAARYPWAMPGLTVADGAAGPATLRLLAWYSIPLLPALVGFQAMCWWALRVRRDRPALLYW